MRIFPTVSRRFIHHIAGAAVLTLLCLPAAAAGPPGPIVTFEAQRVVASGVVRGSSVVFFAVALDPKGYHSDVVRWARIATDADRTGTAVLDLGRPVPWKSIWVVVDLRNNAYTVAAPRGFPARPAPIPPGLLRKSAAANVDRLVRDRIFIDALYVSPSGGAWIVSGQDGSDVDADGASNGSMTVDVQQFQAIDGTTGKASQVEAGGLLFAIDFSRMDVVALRVDGALLGAAR